MYEIICSGFGGQGVLTAGLLLIEAGAECGKFVSWCPSYGSEMRGGTANCNVIVSDDEIGSPYTVAPDILLAMNEPSVDKFQNTLKPGGLVLLNTSMIPADKPIAGVREAAGVKATDIANELNNPRGANIVMLGALMKQTGMFGKDIFIQSLEGYFGKKGRNNPLNIDCFNAGYEKVRAIQR
jgi:2-oxoglutarate ferredoxin oxidoreductase subunit gamma